jgi:hypothetical protein
VKAEMLADCRALLLSIDRVSQHALPIVKTARGKDTADGTVSQFKRQSASESSES